MSARGRLDFEGGLVSDVAPLGDLVASLLAAIPTVHCLRDPTRGGLAAALNDIAAAAAVGIRINESALKIRPQVQAACDLLGLDPLNVANEGKAVVVCGPAVAATALTVLRAHPQGQEAAIIGDVATEPAAKVIMRTKVGGNRIVAVPLGEDLPRIC
jgi:hydrogenase expression/formation protein HypE